MVIDCDQDALDCANEDWYSMSPDQATVFVVDDDPSIRKALTRMFRERGYRVVSSDSAESFLQSLPEDEPGCILLDLQMPGLDGLELQAELERRDVGTPIVFLTGHGDIPLSVRAIRAGAVDFITKPFRDKTLLTVVERAISDDQDARQLRLERREIENRLATLTAREREVFECVVAGLLNKQTARRLGAAEKTIKVHRGRVMSKMQADTVAELVRMAERVGIGLDQ